MPKTRLWSAYHRFVLDWQISEKNGGKKEEISTIREIWRALSEKFRTPSGDCDPLQLPLLEEVATWRLVALRLENALKGEVVLYSPDETVKPHPMLEAIAKARERYRRSLKELLGRVQPANFDQTMNLAKYLQPILEEGADCVEESIVGEELSDDDEDPREIVRRVFDELGDAPPPPGCEAISS